MKLKQNIILKILAFLLAVAAFGSAAAMAVYQIANIEVLWGGYENFYGYDVQQLVDKDYWRIWKLIELRQNDRRSTYETQRMEELEEMLAAENTNLRWQIYLDSEILSDYGNTVEAVPGSELANVLIELSVEEGERGSEAYGELVMWVDETLPVDDEYRAGYQTLTRWKEERVVAAAITGALILAGVLLTVYLCVCSGYRWGKEGVSLGWFHYIPGDLLLAAYIGGTGLLIALANEIAWFYSEWSMGLVMGTIGLCVAGVSVLVISFLITLVARCKGRVLLKHTVIGWVLTWLWRGVKAVSKAVPLIWKVALVGVVYLLACLLLTFRNIYLGVILCPIITLFLLAYLCWWAYQWKRIRIGTKEIIGGNTNYHIDDQYMPPDLKAHADELNNLGQAIGGAVEERMRSEHFKAELITNVSHDLKTPLTSIINYVDLLKKEDIDNPKAAEYIEVLERKSQRLKKLTEDLVEASKASTGAMTVNRERLDLLQLADQALAEYEERLRGRGLTVVRTLPKEPVWVEADGRHLWRVIDNLLSNCGKYALEGTRVYVEVQAFSDCARLSVKNISREELNIPAEQLTERFVRGDESRAAEGSGLGLSIAQSLTELQGGAFGVTIDGDLFKVSVTLPLAEHEVI